jgi:hypothetical protein
VRAKSRWRASLRRGEMAKAKDGRLEREGQSDGHQANLCGMANNCQTR